MSQKANYKKALKNAEELIDFLKESEFTTVDEIELIEKLECMKIDLQRDIDLCL